MFLLSFETLTPEEYECVLCAIDYVTQRDNNPSQEAKSAIQAVKDWLENPCN